MGQNGKIALADRIQKYHPKLKREDIDNWLVQQTSRGSKERRMLTGEEVEKIKEDIEKQGRLEFRILANDQDDKAGIAAARAWIEDKKNKDELERLQIRNEPPPQPRNKEDNNSLFFPVELPNEPPHTYSWVELGKSELYSLHLNNDGLADPRYKGLKDEVEKARANQKTFTVPGLGGCLLYSRKITDWSRRVLKDKEQGKQYEYFVLVRDPLKGQEITGDYLSRAQPGQAASGSRRAIDFTFSAEGGNLFWDLTTKNKPTGSRESGFKRHLAIIFDGQVTSAPVLNEPIRTNGQITGEFTEQEVNDMVRILRAGALPATLKKNPVSQNTMGATLGADTIEKGTWSVLWAFVAVMAFMVLYYRFAGFVACVALMANLLLTVAFMVLVQAAFTLPGLAGLVLMLGMAVDANVLIYERLREERERGASLALAIRNGYDRAFPTIIDTHLTSIFTAIVLYVVGNDQLKGFGISLTVGLIISLFTSLYMTRTLFEIWLYKGWIKDLNFFGGLVRLLHARQWDFMAIRYYWFTATVILTILGAGLFVYRLDSAPERGKISVLNIDFIGGTAYTAELEHAKDISELRRLLENPPPQGDPPEATPVLPDMSVEPIYTRGSSTPTFFTVRTSEKNVQKVADYVSRCLVDKESHKSLLKKILIKGFKVLGPTEAELTFANAKGETDYASPAQVSMIVGEAFASRDLPRSGFSVDKIDKAQNKDVPDRYSALKVRLNEPMSEKEVDRILKDAKVPASGMSLKEKRQKVLTLILKDVQAQFARAPQPERLENFDKQLAASTQQRAIYAILASWIAILLYLWFRFGSWTFGAATVLCLIHDLFFTLGAIAVCHYVYKTWFFGNLLGIHDFKIDLPSVAALLTLVGYSVSDTIVVFDRIREVRGKNPLLTPKIINDSVNQTLTRTLLSSMTVWVVVIVLYIWGGEGVKLFAFVMVVGVIVGTYSSIYIASPLLLIFGEGAGTPADRARAAQQAASAARD
jgi:SecD/SecF fusion protein